MTTTTRMRSVRRVGGRQRGMALMEMLLITVPLCVLSIVLASAIAATGTAKNRSMWKASLKAQQETRNPCAGAPLLLAPSTSPKQGQFTSGLGKAKIIALVGADITLTRWKTETVTEPVPSFNFDKAADQMFPDRSHDAENSATFVCNEPNTPDNDDSKRRLPRELILFGIAFKKSQELY